MSNIIRRYEIIRAKRVLRRMDEEDTTETPKVSHRIGNPRLPFGLCKEYNIEVGDDWTPKDAWDALKGKGVSKSAVYNHLKRTGSARGYRKYRSSPIEKLKNDEHWKHYFERANSRVKSVYPKDKSNSTGINFKGEEVPIKIQGKAYRDLYNKIVNDDGHIDAESLSNNRLVVSMNSIARRCKKKLGSTNKIKGSQREILRKLIKTEYSNMGSARKNESGKYEYDGDVEKGYKACIFIGLPGCGKSTLTDPWSEKNKAFIGDCDTVKSLLPEFQATNGLAAGAVHSESKAINNSVISEFFDGGSRQGDNIAIPMLGASMYGLEEMINNLERAGYDVEIQFAPGDATKSLNRVIARGIETGRIVNSKVITNAGNDPQNNFNYFKNKTNKQGKRYVR